MRVEWKVSLAYGDDVAVAKRTMLAWACRPKTGAPYPDAPAVYIAALAEIRTARISTAAWTKNEDYWDVFFAMNELYYKTLPEKGINFPFPQMDVHLTKE